VTKQQTCELCGQKVPDLVLHEVMINGKTYLACEVCWSEHGDPPTNWQAEEAFDAHARAMEQAEADELDAEAAMMGEFSDMMALALTDDLPDELQDVCDYFI